MMPPPPCTSSQPQASDQSRTVRAFLRSSSSFWNFASSIVNHEVSIEWPGLIVRPSGVSQGVPSAFTISRSAFLS